MDNLTQSVTLQEITSTSLQLDWESAVSLSNSTSNQSYTVSCEAQNLSTFMQNIVHHKVRYTIEGLASSTVSGLLPATRYHCCVADSLGGGFEECRVYQTLSGGEGLTPTAAGVLGGFLGAIITVLVALVVMAIIGITLMTIKKKR